MVQTGASVELESYSEPISCYTAASNIGFRYHLPRLPILKKLNSIYPGGTLPQTHIYGLYKSIEQQLANYETSEEWVTEFRALIRVQDDNGDDLFETDDDGVYVHQLRLTDQNYDLLVSKEQIPDDHNLSFHYDPYNFDSRPERSFFRGILSQLNVAPKEVKVFLFTGGLTDPKKTDFYFEYKGVDERYHLYFPDFVIVKKSGEFLIVEIKSDKERCDETVKRKKKAVERLANVESNKFMYRIIYCATSAVSNSQLSSISDWLESEQTTKL